MVWLQREHFWKETYEILAMIASEKGDRGSGSGRDFFVYPFVKSEFGLYVHILLFKKTGKKETFHDSILPLVSSPTP